jgi:hypothetical protein
MQGICDLRGGEKDKYLLAYEVADCLLHGKPSNCPACSGRGTLRTAYPATGSEPTVQCHGWCPTSGARCEFGKTEVRALDQRCPPPSVHGLTTYTAPTSCASFMPRSRLTTSAHHPVPPHRCKSTVGLSYASGSSSPTSSGGTCSQGRGSLRPR